MSSIPAESTETRADASQPMYEWRTILRHRWPLRSMHWINLLCMVILVGSGLQIFNAHPALYWGEVSTFDDPVFAAQAIRDRGGKARGITTIGDTKFETTGVLGVSTRAEDGVALRRGFPMWATIPGPKSLALGRRWHFFFAWAWVINGVLYLAWSLASKHLTRDLTMQSRDWRGIAQSVRDHLRFRHPVGDDAARYNPLQKLAYLGVIFILAPLAVLTGLAMSPQMDTVLGWWLQLVGGRQSARTLHFLVMGMFVLFTLLHVVMVVYAGPINELRSMITGRFRVRYARTAPAPADGTGEDEHA